MGKNLRNAKNDRKRINVIKDNVIAKCSFPRAQCNSSSKPEPARSQRHTAHMHLNIVKRCLKHIFLTPHYCETTLQTEFAASAGMDPFAIQMSISGCIGAASLSESSPYSFATVQKCTKHELRLVQPWELEVPLICQNGSTQCEWYRCA